MWSRGLSSISTDSCGRRCVTATSERLHSPEGTPHPLAVPPHSPGHPGPWQPPIHCVSRGFAPFGRFVTVDLCSAHPEHLEAPLASGRAPGFAPMAVGPRVDLLSLLVGSCAGGRWVVPPLGPCESCHSEHPRACVWTWLSSSLGCVPARGRAGSDSHPACSHLRGAAPSPGAARGCLCPQRPPRACYPALLARGQAAVRRAPLTVVQSARPSSGASTFSVPVGRVCNFLAEVSVHILGWFFNGIVCVFTES